MLIIYSQSRGRVNYGCVLRGTLFINVPATPVFFFLVRMNPFLPLLLSTESVLNLFFNSYLFYLV